MECVLCGNKLRRRLKKFVWMALSLP
jgi:hypothetical protein